MPCTIKILQPIIGFTNTSGGLDHILISGTASGCTTVVVSVTCPNSDGQKIVPVINGFWSAKITGSDGRFKPLVCACGDLFSFLVTGSVNGTSVDCQDNFSGILPCVPLSQCPTGYVDVKPFDPNADCVNGMRTFMAQIHVVIDPSRPSGITIFIDGINVGSHPSSTSNYNFPVSVPLAPGSHILTYSYTDPSCPPGLGYGINVPACPGCPAIAFVPSEGDCKDDKRSVTIVATIPDQGVAVDASLIHNGNTIAHVNQSGPITLTGTDLFPGGMNTVSVNISQPPGCPPTPFIFSVNSCGDKKPPVTNPGGGGGGSDDGGGGSLACIIGRIFVVLLFATAIFLSVLGLCTPPPADAAILIAAAVAWAVAGVAFGLWLWLCGSRCGGLLVGWESSLFGTWLCAYLLLCCPQAAVAAVAFGAAATALFISWVAICKPSACRIFLELAWVTTVPVASVFTVLNHVIPCGMLSGVEAFEAAVAAAFATAAAIACGAQKGP